ncbi:LysR family transcriptional regulator [Aeromonas salmonicida]|uniref:LysR family transcriptional regulator n=1 Tax=Aeromonas salmonicida TaxID=645 RepID=UPI000C88DB17|nr:LysR family transcriptional regulator [Aeromonas salmonicida]PMU05647.1 hypothetical protein CJI17_07505 [Aeromonas salmonicida]
MTTPDFNLLLTLDALLDEGSVAGAARRLKLSPSAMSRALARLRDTTGDPLLVRAGRGLVPTPRALALRERVSQLVQEAEAVLRPQQEIDPAHLVRTFRLRSSDGFVESVRAALLARLAALKLERAIATLVPGFATALALVRGSDLVATVPALHCASLHADLVTLPLPFPLPGITLALLWHPRLDADPAHRWLRTVIRETCARAPYQATQKER